MREETKSHLMPVQTVSHLKSRSQHIEQHPPTTDRGLVWFVLLHIPLVLLMRQFPVVATVHGLLVISMGLWGAVVHPKENRWSLWIIAYITGAEVLWRMVASSLLPYEVGKYAILIICGIVILRHYRYRPLPILPLLFILCLLPSVTALIGRELTLITIRRFSLGNLLGPIGLAICAIYFYELELDRVAIKRIALLIIAPSLATAVIVLYYVYTLGDNLFFGLSSNDLVTGGFGPNQVSNALGMGIILCWLLLVMAKVEKFLRILLPILMMILLISAIFTFSRGGVYSAGLVIIGTIPFFLKEKPDQIVKPLLIISILGIVLYFIWFWLNDFTAGAAALRFSNTDAAGRWELAVSQINIWLDNPILGVGVGLSQELAFYDVGFSLRAHVEYTRLLAEHGLLGLIALIILFISAVQNYRQAQNWEAKVWVVGLLIFAFAYMTQAATRTIAPSFLYGLTWASLFAVAKEPVSELTPKQIRMMRRKRLASQRYVEG